MTDEKRGWKALPPVLAVAVVAEFAAALLYIVWHFAEPGDKWFARLVLTSVGVHVAASALAAVGIYELARRMTGRVRTALSIAVFALAGGAVMSMVYDWVFAFWQPSEPGSFEKVYSVLQYTSFGIALVAAIALAIATWSKPVVAIGGFVLLVLGEPPRFLYEKIAELLSVGPRGHFMLQISTQLLYAAGFALLVVGATTIAGTTDGRRAVAGLRQVGGALKLRVVAALVGTGLLLLVMVGSSGGGEGAVGVVKLAMMSAAVLNLVAQLMMSFGATSAASAELPDLPRWAMAIAAAVSLWAAGVMGAQLPHLYQMLYGKEHGMFGDRDADALSLAMPLAVTAALAIVSGAIGALAARRGNDELRTHASGKGVGMVALMLSSIGITAWLLPEAKSESGLLMIMFCAAGSGLWAMVLGARLCSLGADAIEAEPGLPAAKIVS